MNQEQVRAKLGNYWRHIPAKYMIRLMSHDWADSGPVPERSSKCRRCEAIIMLDEEEERSCLRARAPMAGRTYLSPGDNSGLWSYRETNGNWNCTNLGESEFECGWAQERIFSCSETMMRRGLIG